MPSFVSAGVFVVTATLALGLPAQAEQQEAMPEMTTYILGLLVKGPQWTPAQSPERAKLQEAHMAHIRSMAASGKLIVAGPLTDGGTIRGILVFKLEAVDEARALAEADPAVKAGRLAVELHPWMVQKGVLPEPQAGASR
jgi:uncharacterized protein YciI